MYRQGIVTKFKMHDTVMQSKSRIGFAEKVTKQGPDSNTAPNIL
jgi:hypothetical protein